ncbi:caffeoylshikimate esterase isoform X1 [Neltuma alba]|uniref:caffeoylshikimate esterase isoform X1 n=1 Tax=Neltuma alba TaxID=207710 RepID=UPI0010A59711|nr:caffeoylshikimate esterase-like isoform X1 [Prosopis alba]
MVCLLANDDSEIEYHEEYIENSRGMKLMTCRWVSGKERSKALIFLCHGYAMECSVTMNSAGRRLAKAGFEVYGMDYEGHGKSEGLPGFVSNFDDVIADCSNYFSSICEKEENKKKMRYLVGESMGGAVALLLDRQKPHFWDGAILVAPMCKIVDEMKPSPLVINMLTALSRIIPKWKLIPTKDIIDIAFKQPQVREQIKNNPLCYKGRPRLKTGYELYRVSVQLERTLQEVSLPFLVLHGEDDKVTDKSVSIQLHKVASSKDKTLKLYPGMWHGLLIGEPPENLNIIYKDIVDWLDDKCKYGSIRLERELKNQNEDNPTIEA